MRLRRYHQKSLGKNFIPPLPGCERVRIVEHLGPMGSRPNAYVNKPGLDLQDVSRGVASSADMSSAVLSLEVSEGNGFPW